ncbi:MAG: FMN-binding protein, partial [Actinomycetota bacterium]|nr:FMN-binding protein [Actinomycetota bacterium]
PVQVRVTLSGNRIVDMAALQLPSDRSTSRQINDVAGPELRQEVLAAQSSQVHTISGATYTSNGYRQSLQAALDQAGHP